MFGLFLKSNFVQLRCSLSGLSAVLEDSKETAENIYFLLMDFASFLMALMFHYLQQPY